MRFKRPILVAILLLAVVCIGALGELSLSQLYLPVWDGTSQRYVWYQLGAGFTKTGNIISVAPVAAPAVTPMRGVKLVYDAVGNKYPLPADAPVALSVYVNGLRYTSPGDFTIVNRTIVPPCTLGSVDCNWPAGPLVVVDYEK